MTSEEGLPHHFVITRLYRVIHACPNLDCPIESGNDGKRACHGVALAETGSGLKRSMKYENRKDEMKNSARGEWQAASVKSSLFSCPDSPILSLPFPLLPISIILRERGLGGG